MKKLVIALATSLGIAAGSFGFAPVPAVAAMSASGSSATEAPPVELVRHGRKHRRLVCHTVWVKKKVWRHHHRVWIKVPKRRCHYVWGWGWHHRW